MKNALIVCKVPSPFIVELAEAVTSSNCGWTLDVWFSEGLGKRGEHWLEGLESDRVMFNVQELSATKSATTFSDLKGKKKYDVVISLLPLHFKDSALLKKLVQSLGAKLVFWHEPPLPRNPVVWAAKSIIYRYLARKLKVAAVWAIGHKAMGYWPRLLGVPGFLIPYYQKLPTRVEKQGDTYSPKIKGERIRFVFSGQLVERNNVYGIVDAISLLIKRGFSGCFEVTFYGDGPLRTYLEDKLEQFGSDLVKLDVRTPKSWVGRLLPLHDADVLLSPALYSGWGLTIPEALALGLPVISTYGVESARYYIEDGWNGFHTGTSAHTIADAMEQFISNPELISDMSKACCMMSEKGGVERGGKVISRLLSYVIMLN